MKQCDMCVLSVLIINDVKLEMQIIIIAILTPLNLSLPSYYITYKGKRIFLSENKTSLRKYILHE